LEAWYEWETCESTGKSEARKRFFDLIDSHIQNTSYSRQQIMDAFYSQFKELKAQKWKNSKVSVAQTASRPPVN